MEDVINQVLNVIAPPLACLAIWLTLTSFRAFKRILSLLNFFFREDVAGKVILITGASSGIGERGERIVCGRSQGDASINFGSPDVIFLRTDVSNVHHCKLAVDAAITHFGKRSLLRGAEDGGVKITIATPGYIESEMTQGKHLSKEGQVEVDQEIRDVQVGLVPDVKVGAFAKAVVNGTLRGQRLVVEPADWKVLCPDVLDWGFRWLYGAKPILHFPSAH